MKNGQMMRLAAVALLLAVMTGAAGCAAADSAEVFRYIMTGEYRNTRAQTVVIDDALMLRIPEGWELEESGEENTLTFVFEDDYSRNTMTAVWGDMSEENYAIALEELEGITDCTCNADRSGFLFKAGNAPDGVYLFHRAQGERTYMFGFLYESMSGRMSDRVMNDFCAMVDSLMPVDEADLAVLQMIKETPAPEGTPVTFADLQFEAMLRAALGRGDEAPIYSGELETISKLYIAHGQIDFYDWQQIGAGGISLQQPLSLADLQLFPNLYELYVCDMQVADVACVADCASLERVSLIGCGLESCEVFAPMTQLKHLSLARNAVRDITPLAGMTNLETLNLHHTQAQSLEPVRGMKALKQLLISGTQVTTLEPLRECAALEWLSAADIAGATLSLEPLGGLMNLHTVELDGTRVTGEAHIAHVRGGRME